MYTKQDIKDFQLQDEKGILHDRKKIFIGLICSLKMAYPKKKDNLRLLIKNYNPQFRLYMSILNIRNTTDVVGNILYKN